MTFRPPVQMSHIWEQVKARLSGDATLTTLLYGAGHVYLEGEDYSQPEGDETAPWLRVVIAPAGPLWPSEDAPGLLVRRAFIVRVEVSKFDTAGYNHQLACEAVQSRIQVLLDHWAPPDVVGQATTVRFPIYYARIIEPRILWDESRRLYFLTSEYRLEVSSG